MAMDYLIVLHVSLGAKIRDLYAKNSSLFCNGQILQSKLGETNTPSSTSLAAFTLLLLRSPLINNQQHTKSNPKQNQSCYREIRCLFGEDIQFCRLACLHIWKPDHSHVSYHVLRAIQLSQLTQTLGEKIHLTSSKLLSQLATGAIA